MLNWPQSTMRTYTWLFLLSCFVRHGTAEVLFGQISSPGYPGPYPPNRTMTWTISVPQGRRIKLQFTHFDVGEGNEHSQDYVKVIDVGQPLVTASGQLHTATCDIPEPLEFISVSNTLTLTFSSRPVQRRHYQGFHAVYTVLAHDECANRKTPCAHYCHSHPAGYFCSCAHGYVLGRDNASCEETDLFCTLEVPAYAKLDPKQQSYKAGQQVIVTCLEGYGVVMPDQSRKRSYQAKCQKNGQWDHYQHCQVIDCGHPQIDEGYITYLSQGNSTTYGATILYKCRIYYELSPPGNGIYRCSADGKWVNSHARTELPKCLPVCGVSVSLEGFGRIFGGSAVENGMVPWQVYFQNPRGSGALISDQWVLTAAHVVEEEESPEMYAGIRDLINIRPRHRLVANKVFLHDKWKRNVPDPRTDYDNDIALIKLKAKVELNELVLPICLPGEDLEYILKKGSIGYISGWGKTKNKDQAQTLQMALISVGQMANCQKEKPDIGDSSQYVFSSNMICAGGNGKDSCQGDSGGAFVIQDPHNDTLYFAAGIVSWGPKCGTFGLYTNVRNYLDWIKKTMLEQNDT